MERKPRKLKKRRVSVPLDTIPLDTDTFVSNMSMNIAHASSNPIFAEISSSQSLIYDQDYEYELSVIADMEKQEREQQKERAFQEENKKGELRVQIENRDFHIKQVLRKLKLGSSTNPQDRLYIQLLEAWMESTDAYLQTEYAESFHRFFENGIRLNNETKEYMRIHISPKSIAYNV